MDRFGLSFGNEFVVFAVPTIVCGMKRFFRDTGWAVHVPRRLQERRADLARATDALTADPARAPTVGELADHLTITREEVVEAQVAAGGPTARSVGGPLPGCDGGETASWAQQTGDDDPGFATVDDLVALKPPIAPLPERERRVPSLCFGDEMTQARIGAELGYSQMHVSQHHQHTLAEVRRGLLPEE